MQQCNIKAEESWLIYQAQSYLRRQDVSLQQAQELFERIDINTRLPKSDLTIRRPSGVVAALRALFGGGILLLASGCTHQDPPGPSQLDSSGFGVIETPFAILESGNKLYKIVDDAAENVCYVGVGPNGIDVECMVDFSKGGNSR